MTRTVLASIVIIAAVSLLMAGGIYAGFGDTETGQASFAAGTIDLKVNDFEWTTPVTLQDMQPRRESESYTFKNIGSLPGVLTFSWANLQNVTHPQDEDEDYQYAALPDGDGEPARPEWWMNAEQYARLVYVEITNDGGAEEFVDLGEIDANGDGYISLYELMTYGKPIATLPTFTSDETVTIKFRLGDYFDDGDGNPPADWVDYHQQVDPEPAWEIYSDSGAALWNVPQADGIKLDFTAKLMQKDS